MMTLPGFLARQGADRIVYRVMKGWGRSFSSVRGTALPINEFHAWYINQQHHLYCACISAGRTRILIRWFANTARGHFLLWNKTEPTALLNQYRGLECYRKPREQTKAFFFQSKSMAKYFCSWFINLRRPGKQTNCFFFSQIGGRNSFALDLRTGEDLESKRGGRCGMSPDIWPRNLFSRDSLTRVLYHFYLLTRALF